MHPGRTFCIWHIHLHLVAWICLRYSEHIKHILSTGGFWFDGDSIWYKMYKNHLKPPHLKQKKHGKLRGDLSPSLFRIWFGPWADADQEAIRIPDAKATQLSRQVF